MKTTNKVARLARGQEVTRVRGEEFNKWQKESAKIKCNRVMIAEVASKK